MNFPDEIQPDFFIRRLDAIEIEIYFIRSKKSNHDKQLHQQPQTADSEIIESIPVMPRENNG